MNKLCSAERIQVAGGDTMGSRFTYCSTFRPRSFTNYLSEIRNINLNGAVRQLFSDRQVMDPQVACNAVNCIYNDNQVCGAEHLKIVSEVAETTEQTECQTFTPRAY